MSTLKGLGSSLKSYSIISNYQGAQPDEFFAGSLGVMNDCSESKTDNQTHQLSRHPSILDPLQHGAAGINSFPLTRQPSVTPV